MLPNRPPSSRDKFAAAVKENQDKICISLICADNKYSDIVEISFQNFLVAADASKAVARLENLLTSFSCGQRWRLTIPRLSSHGFSIELNRLDAVYRLRLGGLEEEMESLQGALWWIEMALSGKYRLTTWLARRRAFQYRFEPVSSTGPILSTGHFSIMSWFCRVEIEAHCIGLFWGGQGFPKDDTSASHPTPSYDVSSSRVAGVQSARKFVPQR